jgi:HEPN domain-containing protein
MNETKDEIIRKTKEWFSYADGDLYLAQIGLDSNNKDIYRLIGYHAQQCVEKYLKAYLVFHLIDFPYTHSITLLLDLCSEKADWTESIRDAEELTPYATTARYPSEDGNISKDEVIKTIEIATKIRQTVRAALKI